MSRCKRIILSNCSLVLLLFLVVSCNAYTTSYEGTSLDSDGSRVTSRFSVEVEGANHFGPLLNISFRVQSEKYEEAAALRGIVFHSDDRSLVSEEAESLLCCVGIQCNTQHEADLASAGITVLNLPLRSAQAHEIKTTLRNRDDKRPFHQSGVYYLVLLNCPNSLSGSIEFLSGSYVRWRNPFGYLSAEEYPFLPFYQLMAVAYLLLEVAWIVQCTRYWKDVLPLQNAISLVIGTGILESVMWYFESTELNDNGELHMGALSIAVFFTTLRSTASRLLILVVCMGYGIVRSSLGDMWRNVTILGCAYFLSSLAFNLFDVYDRHATSSRTHSELLFGEMLVSLPVVILEAAMYWWILYSLMRTISLLKMRQQNVKLGMFYRLLWILIFACTVMVGFLLAQILISLFWSRDQQWKTFWLWRAVPSMVFYAVLLLICYLWRPTANNDRYSYSPADDVNNEIEMSTFELARPDVSKRRPGEDVVDIDVDIEAKISANLLSELMDSEDEEQELSKLE